MKFRRFGEILKKNRELRRLSIRDLSKILKVSATLISKWEIGKYPPPRKPEIIRKISQALALHENELIEIIYIENILNDLPPTLREALKRSLYIHLKTNFTDQDGFFKGPDNIRESLLPLAVGGKDPETVKLTSFIVGNFNWDKIDYQKFKTLDEWIINDFLMQLLCKISLDFVDIHKDYSDIKTFLRNEERLFLVKVHYLKPDDSEEIFLLDSDGINISASLLI